MSRNILNGKKILLCVTGSIAAYKAVILLRLLIKDGAEVRVLMTRGAIDFVSPLTFSTLSKNKVLSELFEEDNWSNHVMLGRWADVMLVAPVTCNTIAKMAHGICDNLLLATYLSSVCPVMIAPAMDEDMWHHAATQSNVERLRQRGNEILPVADGELASGLKGEGRMLEPEQIVGYLAEYFSKRHSLEGLRALVTAGPTYEPIDPVRFLGNRSTGTMGVALATELAVRGASVRLVIGPSDVALPASVETFKVTTADEMYEACLPWLRQSDIIVMAAAVADYSVRNPSAQKIKKENGELHLVATKTRDILLAAGKEKSDHQTLVGFALETTNERQHALDKLAKKNADLIVLNSLNDDGAGFGSVTNKITIFDRKGNEYQFGTKLKKDVANDIVNTIITYRNA